jgi:UDP-N-acetylglucosamine 2-epimerase
MPQEINRVVTGSISDYFFVIEESGIENFSLRRQTRRQDPFCGKRDDR